MVDMKKLAEERRDAFSVDPQHLVVVIDKTHPLYDERTNLPLDEALVLSVMEHGIRQPVVVRRNGPLFEVQDGRQRVRAAIEANARFKKNKSDQKVLVPLMMSKDDDQEAACIMVALNEIRTQDTPMVKARKAKRLLDQGVAEATAARQFGLSIPAFNQLLTLLDTDKSVQNAVDQGQVAVTAASKLAALPREEQKQAMEDLKASGKKATVKNVTRKVKAKKEARRTGAPEREAAEAPSKKLITQVCDAYDAIPKPEEVEAHGLLLWVLTGKGAEDIKPGPDNHKTLAEFLKVIVGLEKRAAKNEAKAG